MMPASTTLASSQPRWGDQKAPITAAPKTSQNPFRHLVERGAVRKREQEVAGRTHAAVGWGPHGSVPASLVIANPFVVARRCRVQARPKDGGAENKDLARSNNKGEPGEERGGQRYFEAPVRPGSRPHRVSEGGGDGQMFGAKQQVPHGGFSD